MALTVEATRRPFTTSAASRRSPIRELVQEPMKTRSSRISDIGVPGSSAMYSSARSSPSEAGSGTAPVTPTTMPGVVPQVTCGETAAGVHHDLPVEARAVVGAQLAPLVERQRVGRGRAPLDPLEGGVVGGDHPGAAAALDRHVADRHAALHREPLDRRAGVLDHVADAALDAHLADRGEDQVLGASRRSRARPRSGSASTAAFAAGASAWPARARPRSSRCRTRARRRRRGWRCASRRRRSSCRAG